MGPPIGLHPHPPFTPGTRTPNPHRKPPRPVPASPRTKTERNATQPIKSKNPPAPYPPRMASDLSPFLSPLHSAPPNPTARLPTLPTLPVAFTNPAPPRPTRHNETHVLAFSVLSLSLSLSLACSLFLSPSFSFLRLLPSFLSLSLSLLLLFLFLLLLLFLQWPLLASTSTLLYSSLLYSRRMLRFFRNRGLLGMCVGGGGRAWDGGAGERADWWSTWHGWVDGWMDE